MFLPRRALLLATLCLGTLAPVSPGQDEPKFFSECADDLDKFAAKCLKSGYPRRARQVWSEVLRDYDTDHEASRKALGYLRVGRTWAPDRKFEFPTEERPDPAVARVLGKQWDRIAEQLADGHLEMAKLFNEAGMAPRATYHYERVLRFRVDDKTAIAATGRKLVGGFTGSAVELAILQNSQSIDAAIEKQLKTEHEVREIRGSLTNPYLDKAGIDVRGFESEHFVIWGNWPDEILIDCAQYAERALAFCEGFLGENEGYGWRPKQRVQFVFYKQRDQWKQMLEANADAFSGNLSFVIQNTSATALGSGASRVQAVGFETEPSVRDMAIRKVVQNFCGMQSDALVEGVGHAVVGWFLGRNLVFSVAQERDDARTSTGANRDKFKMPDLEVWKELAIEIAWQGTDTPSAEIPLISAAQFSSEARIKSWSLCDYLMRRDADLLRKLDRSKRSATNKNQVREAFAEMTDGLALDALDDAWRRFWTEDTPILQAVLGKGEAFDAISKDAPKLLAAFNEMRELCGQSPVVWSAEYSVACQQHAAYLKADKKARGPVAEHTQNPGKGGGTGAGRTFAQRALVATKYRKVDDLIESWLQWPGYRDALLDPGLVAVGIWAERGMAVFDVTRGRGSTSTLVRFPAGVKVGSGLPQSAGPNLLVAGAVDIKDLGPEVAEALKNAGAKRGKQCGTPISVHFFSPGALPASDSIRCTVLEDGKTEVDGVVVVADTGQSRRSAASGLVVFYPLAPLERGSAYTVTWAFRQGGNPRTLETYQFFTK